MAYVAGMSTFKPKNPTSKQLLEALQQMLLIREFEKRGIAVYLQGLVGGFYHSSAGQEAIGVSAVQVFGKEHWYTTTYRCHGMALLLGATPNEVMAELFGKATGNAKGRGGSMHLYAEKLLGGFGIVGGHLPIATGAAFSLKSQHQKDKVSICFLGDGAVAQGAFHESLNLASLWDLPIIYIIENNQWGMGTHVERAIAAKEIAKTYAPSYNMSGYTIDGMDYYACHKGFQNIYHEVLECRRPILVECLCERFEGHSISDPGLYRTKEELHAAKERDPIAHLRVELGIDEQTFKDMKKEIKEKVLEAVAFAKASPDPSIATLEEEVYAP